MSSARIACHSASYPASARLPSTASIPRIVSAPTFSAMTYLGRIPRITLSISNQRPLRLPLIPAPLPAVLISWQGNPPVIIHSLLHPTDLLPMSDRFCPVSGLSDSMSCRCVYRLFLELASFSQSIPLISPSGIASGNRFWYSLTAYGSTSLK